MLARSVQVSYNNLQSANHRYIFLVNLSLSPFRYELCVPTKVKQCEPSEREKCKYEYRTAYEEVCREEAVKVCDKVFLFCIA